MIILELESRIEKIKNEDDRAGLLFWLNDYKHALKYKNDKIAKQLLIMITSKLV